MTQALQPSPDAPQADLGSSSTGLDPKVAATLTYLMGWLTGLLFLVLERENRYVRFHAMQSIVGLGGLWALGMAFWMLAVVSILLGDVAARFLVSVAQLVWVAGLIAWLICLFKAYAGERWKLPIAGNIAERLAGD